MTLTPHRTFLLYLPTWLLLVMIHKIFLHSILKTIINIHLKFPSVLTLDPSLQKFVSSLILELVSPYLVFKPCGLSFRHIFSIRIASASITESTYASHLMTTFSMPSSKDVYFILLKLAQIRFRRFVTGNSISFRPPSLCVLNNVLILRP